MSLPFLMAGDFYMQMSRDALSGFALKEIVGVNADVDAGTEDIWNYGGNITHATTAAKLCVSSSNAADLEFDVTVVGLDANYNEITEVIATDDSDGQTKVTGTKTFLRVNSVTIAEAAAGDIYVYYNDTVTAGVPDTASKVQAKVAAADLQAYNAIYTVPNNKNWYLIGMDYSSANATTATAVVLSAIRKIYGGANETVKTIKYDDLGTGKYTDGHMRCKDHPVLFAAKSEIRFTATLAATGENLSVTVNASFVEEDVDQVANSVDVIDKATYLAYLSANGRTIASQNYWLIGIDELPLPNMFPLTANIDEVLTTITGATNYTVAADTEVAFDAAYFTSGKLVLTDKKGVLTLMRCVDNTTAVKYVLAPLNTIINLKNTKKVNYLHN